MVFVLFDPQSLSLTSEVCLVWRLPLSLSCAANGRLGVESTAARAHQNTMSSIHRMAAGQRRSNEHIANPSIYLEASASGVRRPRFRRGWSQGTSGTAADQRRLPKP